MLVFPKHFFYVLFLATTISAAPMELESCGFLDSLVGVLECDTMASRIDSHVRNGSFKEYFKVKAKLCEEAMNCYEKYQCRQYDERKNKLEPKCEIMDYETSNIKQCLIGFFKTAHLAQYSDQKTCFQDYSFVDKNPTKRNEAYTDGDSCFLNYIEENCDNDTLIYLHNNYKRFAKSMSFDPIDPDCNHPHYYLENLYGRALIEEIASRHDQLNESKADRRFVEDTILICKEIKAMQKRSCYFRKNSGQHMEIHRSCRELEDSPISSD